MYTGLLSTWPTVDIAQESKREMKCYLVAHLTDIDRFSNARYGFGYIARAQIYCLLNPMAANIASLTSCARVFQAVFAIKCNNLV